MATQFIEPKQKTATGYDDFRFASHPDIIATDANNRFVSDAEKNIWNNKEDKLPAGTCVTAAATVAKVGTLAGFTLHNGAMVALKFTYANTAANPTLNVNSTGAKAIFNSLTNVAVKTGDIAANMTAVFKYNGTQWMLINPAQALDSAKLGGLAASGYAKTVHTHVPSDVGLGNVNNTADSAKSVASAAKLTTARQLNGVVFDGSSDKQIPLWNAIVGHDTANTTTPWFKLASIQSIENNWDHNIVFHVHGTFDSSTKQNGILHVGIRTSALTTSRPAVTCMWEYMNDMVLSDFVVAFNEKTTPMIAEIWVKSTRQYNRFLFNVLSESNRTSNTSPGLIWTLYNKPTGSASITAGLLQLASTYQPNFDASFITAGQISPDRIAMSTTSANGLMSSADKTKLDGIATGANKYTHPTGDGNLHVPATSTTNNGKFLMAGSTAGSVSWGTPANTTYSAATTSANGLMSSADKTKLDGITAGANKTTVVNSTSSTSTTDAAAAAAVKAAYDLANGKAGTAVATISANGLMSSADKTKLDGIATGAEVNQNAFSNVKVGATTVAADAKTDTLELVAGSNITLTPDATNDKITIAATNTTYTHPATHPSAIIAQDGNNRFVTDGEKAAWNGKANPSAATSDICVTISDWDNARTNGYYMSSPGAANSPPNQAWYYGYVIVHNDLWCTQTAQDFASYGIWYERHRRGGNWTAWQEREPKYCVEIGNWNEALANGYYSSAPGAANAPVFSWCYGYVFAHNDVWCTQVVQCFGQDWRCYKRQKQDGNWQPWTEANTIVENTAHSTSTTNAASANAVNYVRGVAEGANATANSALATANSAMQKASGSVIKSVQRGTRTWPTPEKIVDIPISSINPSKSTVQLYGSLACFSGGTSKDIQPYVSMLSSTNLRIAVYESPAFLTTYSWEIVEYN